MADFVENVTPYYEGCEAMRITTDNRLLTPVCMGGTALVGCNNPNECMPLYGKRIDDACNTHVVFIDKNVNRVTSITTVAREPLVPVEPPPQRDNPS